MCLAAFDELADPPVVADLVGHAEALDWVVPVGTRIPAPTGGGRRQGHAQRHCLCQETIRRGADDFPLLQTS